jgi:murein tripeptide amidase MpaA
MDFNRYFTNDEITACLHEWTAAYPELCTLIQIGESYEKRPIWLVSLTNRNTGPDIEKPAVWIDANIHATEITGSTTALSLIYSLLDGYGKNEQATRLLDHSVYYVTPRVNPDGAALAMKDSPRYVRSGVRAYPFLEKEEGLHEEDIDGDGRIIQMRIPDPNGDWKVSSLDPRLMEKRGPAEMGGQYYRLLFEGKLEEYDGIMIPLARPLQGLDFNRNFPFEWRTEGEQSGAGPYPASEPEIKALVDFVARHHNINLAITYHTFGRVILRPFSTKADEEMETNDLWVYKKIGELGTSITGYRNVSVFHDFKYHPKEVTTGAFDDWMYDHRGIFAYTIELWDLPTEAGIKDRKLIEWYRDHPHEEDVQILKWAEENAGAKAYTDWFPFEHPQLGSVELGGWDHMYTWRNPPASIVGAEAARNIPFALALGDMLPHLELHKLEVYDLGKGDYRLTLVVQNGGFLPTYTSHQGKKRKAMRPVRAELELPPGVTLLNGKKRTDLGHLEGRSNKLDVASVWGEAPTDHRARSEWVMHANEPVVIKLHVQSERAGALHMEIHLG